MNSERSRILYFTGEWKIAVVFGIKLILTETQIVTEWTPEDEFPVVDGTIIESIGEPRRILQQGIGSRWL